MPGLEEPQLLLLGGEGQGGGRVGRGGMVFPPRLARSFSSSSSN